MSRQRAGGIFVFLLLFSIGMGASAVAVDSSAETETKTDTTLIINEIHADPDATSGDANGDGTVSTSQDEFIELVNNSGQAVDVSDWTLTDNVKVRHLFPAATIIPDGCGLVVFSGGTPTGTFGGGSVQTASTGSLGFNNDGDTLTLSDSSAAVVATYAYGTEGGDNQSLTRSPDVTGADPLVKHTTVSAALFSPGTRSDGSVFNAACQKADVNIGKSGPSTLAADAPLIFEIAVTNSGVVSAETILITDTLPTTLSYSSDTSGLPLTTSGDMLIWQVGTLAPGQTFSFTLTTTPQSGFTGAVVNEVLVSTSSAELSTANNSDSHTTLIGDIVLINALHPHALQTGDEAIQLINTSDTAIDIGGWQLSDGGTPAILPPAVLLAAGAKLWITDDAADFTRQFGFTPDYSAADFSSGSWPGYANGGDEAYLYSADGQLVDTLVFGSGEVTALGWSGDAVQPYQGGSFGTAGQILYRMRDQLTGMPVADTNSAESWAQSTDDIINGRKILYPGWDLDQFFQTYKTTQSATLTVAIAPDNSFDAIVAQIEAADSSIQLETLIFTNLAIMQSLVDSAERGVAVDVLLEGSPAGGILDQERYLCQLLENAGGNCWFSISEADQKIYDRYRFMHAKFALFDGKMALVSSENFTGSSMPYDDKSDGTWGRRGVVLITDAAGIIDHLTAIWQADFDPANHAEILPWSANHADFGNKYGLPAANFIPDDDSGGITYTLRYPAPSTFQGTFSFEVVQSPDNSLRTADSLLGLVAQAGVGDTVLVQQLNERKFWGSPSTDSIVTDPNPRLEAYIEAARRGARVRIMLDAYHLEQFYNPSDLANNAETCRYVSQLAHSEHISIDCALVNKTGLGIHNKMVLVEVGGIGTIHIGSINGTEQSSKGNRELALQVQSNEAYTFLASMFEQDWPHIIYLPIVGKFILPPADHLLISEVLYNPSGSTDDEEFIEIVNPTQKMIDLSSFALGDAINPMDFADLRRFPAGTQLQPGKTLVVAKNANAFQALFGSLPDFEIQDSNINVPQLEDDLAWGSPDTFLQLGNGGDVVLLRDAVNNVIDVFVYGSKTYPNHTVCLAVSSGSSLERDPFNRDTDDCIRDFREAFTPSPGSLP